jgi:hypothetical protein
MLPHYSGFMITLRHTTLGTTPLDERSARRRELYLTAHKTHNRQTSTPPAEFEPTIPASERPQTHALDLAATGISIVTFYVNEIKEVTVACRSTETQMHIVLCVPRGESCWKEGTWKTEAVIYCKNETLTEGAQDNVQ